MIKHVINLSDVARAVPIVNDETKERREIIVQPKGKPTLPAGFGVEEAFLKRNPFFQVVEA